MINKQENYFVTNSNKIGIENFLDVFQDLILNEFEFDTGEIERMIPYLEAGESIYGDIMNLIEQQVYTQIETFKDGTEYPYYYFSTSRDRDYLNFIWQNGISENDVIPGPSTISVTITPVQDDIGNFSDKVIGIKTLDIELYESKFINNNQDNMKIGLILIVILIITIFAGLIALIIKNLFEKRGE